MQSRPAGAGNAGEARGGHTAVALARGGRAEEDKPNGAWTGAGEARGGRRVEEQVHGGQGTWVTPAGAPD